jgi:NifU-like protein
MPWEYSEKTKELFMDAIHGKPGTHLGEIDDPDGMGEHGSLACGDAMRFTFRVEKNASDPTKDVITEAKYLTFGCTSAIASSEALCSLIEQGQYTPIDALKITNKDIVDYLEGLPAQKIHCSVMGAEALEAAVFDWAKRRDVNLSELGVELPAVEEQDGRIVCECFSTTEPYLRRKIQELDLKTIPAITDALKAGGGCASCHHTPGGLQDILNEVWGTEEATTAVAGAAAVAPAVAEDAPASPFQFGKAVEKALNDYVRPMLQADGGDVELVDIKDYLIYVRLRGACASCVGAEATLRSMVELNLKNQVDDRIRAIAV